MDVDKEILRDLANERIQYGEKLTQDAGFRGDMSDGGGGVIIRDAQAFLAGLNGEMPLHWGPWYKKRIVDETKERMEYERLKKKFEHDVDQKSR